MIYENWFYTLKQKVIFLTVYKLKMQKAIFEMVKRFPFLLTDIILDEPYCLLEDLEKKIHKMMETMVELIKRLEVSQESFIKEDLEMMVKCLETSLIHENRMHQNFYQLLLFRKEDRLTEEGFARFKKKESDYQQKICFYEEIFYNHNVDNERNPNGRL